MLTALILAATFAGPQRIAPHRSRPSLPTSTPAWLQFDTTATNILAPAPNAVPHLAQLWRVALPETADGSPAYVGSVITPKDGRAHNLLIVTTTQGRTVAIDSLDGRTVWQTEPPTGPRWTSSSPAVDPGREFVFSYGLDGYVHKYSIADGNEVIGAGWPELVTRKGDVEKGSSALSIATAKDGNTYLYMPIAGYPIPGDAGDYQGHLVTINVNTGRQTIFNAACSDRSMHFVEGGDDTNDCSNVQSGIWARSGAVYDPVTDRVFVTTGNGVFDADTGGFNWGDSVIALRPDGSSDRGTPLDSYTPVNQQWMSDNDADLASTTVAILPLPETSVMRLAVQGGKDWYLRLLNLGNLSGTGGPRHLGGEIQLLKVPQGGEVHTRPATWTDSGGTVWVFVATDLGVSGLSLDTSGASPALVPKWSIPDPATTPVVANGVLYFAHDHEIVAIDPTTGNRLWAGTEIGTIHWQSPIVIEDAVYLEDSDGYLNAYAPR